MAITPFESSTLLGTQNADNVNITGGTIAGVTVTSLSETVGNLTVSGTSILGVTTVSTLTTTGGSGSGIVRTAGNITAAGTVQGNATAIAHDIEWVLGANAAAGVILPTATAGVQISLKNDDTANAVLKVYPSGNATINALSGAAAISMAAKTSAVFACYTSGDTGKWFTIPLLPS